MPNETIALKSMSMTSENTVMTSFWLQRASFFSTWQQSDHIRIDQSELGGTSGMREGSFWDITSGTWYSLPYANMEPETIFKTKRTKKVYLHNSIFFLSPWEFEL